MLRRVWFIVSTAPRRHGEAFSFFLINVLLQLIPLGVAELNSVVTSQPIDIGNNAAAAWSLFAFGIWNAPAAIRIHKTNPAVSNYFKLAFYSAAFVVTFIVFWVMFSTHEGRKLSVSDGYLAVGMPILLAFLLFVLLLLINYFLLFRVGIRLLWVDQAQFSGFYAAKYFGIFAKHGLRVSLVPADPMADTPALDRFGALNQFAIVSSSDVPKARDRGLKVRAVRVIVPDPAIIFMAKEGSGIRSPSDFKQRRIAYRPLYEEADILQVLLRQHGLELTDVIHVAGSVDSSEFLKGDVDVVAGHVAVEPLAYSFHHKVSVRQFEANLPGGCIFADTLVTTDQVINAAPEIVRAVVRAVSEGWDHVGKYPQSGLSSTLFVLRKYDQKTRHLQEAIQGHMLGLRQSGIRDRIGETDFGMRDADWEPIIKAMADCGIIGADVKASDMYWR